MGTELAEPYPPILDWTPEGRAQLVADHRDTILCLLVVAFGKAEESTAGILRRCRFGGEDVIYSAALWALARFGEPIVHLDPSRLKPEDRSFRLFTRAKFWLTQKVGSRAWAKIYAEMEHISANSSSDEIEKQKGDDHLPGSEDPPKDVWGILLEAEKSEFRERLGCSVRDLHACTCPTMVAAWLEGTTWLRSGNLFEVTAHEVGRLEGDKKTRALLRFDALFRLQCLYHAFIPAPAESLELLCVEATLLTRCEDRSPFRNKDGDVARSRQLPVPARPREVTRMRRAGCRDLIGRLLDVIDGVPLEGQHIDWLLTVRSLGSTTLHALNLDEGPVDLAERLRSLPDGTKPNEIFKWYVTKEVTS